MTAVEVPRRGLGWGLSAFIWLLPFHIVAMAILRKVLHLEEYLRPVHFQNLGKLLLLMSLLWGYFTFVERAGCVTSS